jgi:hypothetical protein
MSSYTGGLVWPGGGLMLLDVPRVAGIEGDILDAEKSGRAQRHGEQWPWTTDNRR